MRLSIIALASFVICAVFASPIISGRDFDNGLSLSRRGPTAKGSTPPKTSKNVPKTPKKAPKTSKNTLKTPKKAPKTPKKGPKTPTNALKTTPKKAAGKAPMSCPIRKKIKKRANEEIVKAVDMAIASGGRGAGRGAGKVYPLTFGGQDAVIKMVGPKQSEADVEKEVKNLVGVHQYLAWAIKEDKDGKKQYFIIMKHMGKTPKELIAGDKSLKQAVFTALLEPTAERYKKEFKATNPDTVNGNNIVFHQTGGEWVGEIIDWEIGTVEGDHALPAAEIIKEEAESCS